MTSSSSSVVGKKTRSIAVLIGTSDATTAPTGAGAAASASSGGCPSSSSGGCPSSSSSSESASSRASASLPVVVWTLQERPSHIIQQERQQKHGGGEDAATPSSSHKYDLVYYEFLDDTARWTHLDQLLLQLYDDTGYVEADDNDDDDDDDVSDDDGRRKNNLPSISPNGRSKNKNDDFPSIHVGTSDNLEKLMTYGGKGRLIKKQRRDNDTDDDETSTTTAGITVAPSPAMNRTKRVLESIHSFLEGRFNIIACGNNHHQTHQQRCVHVHWNVPVQSHIVDSSLDQLLLDNEEAHLAVRGHVQLSQPLIRQGLALWLQSQGLYSGGGSSSGPTFLENQNNKIYKSLKVKCGNHDMTSHLVMDRTAAQAIHLLPPPNDGVASVVGGNFHNNSLFGLLSKHCRTAMGKKLLNLWLRQPLTNLSEIEQRQQAVSELMGVARDSVRDGLRSFSGGGSGESGGQSPLVKLASGLAKYRTDDDHNDIGNSAPLVSKVGDTRKALETLYKLYLLSARHLPNLLDSMDDIQHSSSTILVDLHGQISQLVSELSRSVGLAEAVLDMDQAPREYLVKPQYSPELDELHQQMDEVHQAVQDEWNVVEDAWNDLGLGDSSSKKAGTMYVRLERVESDASWQFRLPSSNHSKDVDGLGTKVHIHRILKNGVYFSTLELRQLSQKYADLNDEYSKKSRRIVSDAMSIASTYSTVVERAAEAIGNIDAFCALAHTAAMNPNGYCKPQMTDSDDDGASISLIGVRHPCLELQEGMDFIPNDLNLTFPDAQLLVSGPNCGGKSVYIRSIGAIVCMAQIGSYVPCTSAKINICHSILARVGAGDLQDRGISTFMAEMLEASSILKSATKRSLIIIDELGRGTSTFDGYGIARAILQYIMDEVGCFVVFATHFHELTHLNGVKNCHVTAQKGDQGLTFLYEIRPGPCLESFGIQVAEMANMPRVVIEDAKKRARELESLTEDGEDTDWSHMTESQRKLQRFAKLDLPAFLQETRSYTSQERKAKLQMLLA